MQEIKVLIYKRIFDNFLLIFDSIKKSNLEQINKIKDEDFIVFLKIKKQNCAYSFNYVFNNFICHKYNYNFSYKYVCV